jgi:hypothetical protein
VSHEALATAGIDPGFEFVRMIHQSPEDSQHV